MDLALQTLIESYIGTFATVIMDVLTVVVPAAVGLLVIRLSISWAKRYFHKFAR